MTHSEQRFGEKHPRYYGWRVVFAAHLGILVGFSLYAYTFGIFVKPLSAQFSWNRETISHGFAISALAAAICSPLAGRWLDRYGPRRILLFCMTAFGAAIAAMSSLSTGLWQFYVTCFVIGAVGNIGQMGYAQLISTWFEEYRGTALGLVLAGDGIGLMVIPVLAQTVITHAGWRAAYLLLGALVLIVSVPPAFLFAHSRIAGPAKSSGPVESGYSLGEGLRTQTFWIIAVVLFLASMSVNGAITHQVPLLTDRGLAARSAALTISVLGAASLAGRLVTGWLLDRFPGSRVAFALLALGAGGILILARLSSLPLACLSAALLGLGAGGTSSTTPYLLTRYFGLRSFSTLYGLTWTFYAVAGGSGPVLLGRVFDRTGSYTSALTVFGFLSALGAVLMLRLPRYPSEQTDRAKPKVGGNFPGAAVLSDTGSNG